MKWLYTIAAVLGLVAAFALIERYPLHVVSALVLLVAVGLVNGYRTNRKNMSRGWRVGHQGRDEMFYDEWREGRWDRISISGEMLTGKAHHVIYFSSLRLPEWAGGRRNEILDRIKQEFKPPHYEYQETEQAGVSDGDKPPC